MAYTFKPGQKFAKASGANMKISTKKAAKICRVIRRKKLTQAKRLLNDMLSKKRSLDGRYYTKAAKEIRMLLESCEKNADFLGLNTDALFVHASAHQGSNLRRRRRKSGFGSRIKSTNLEVMLIEKGKLPEKAKKQAEHKKEMEKAVPEKEAIKKEQKEKHIEKKTKKAEKEEKRVPATAIGGSE